MTRPYRYTLLIALLFFQLFVEGGTHADSKAPLHGLDDYIRKGMKDWEVPGLAVAVVQNDDVILMKGFGTRELGKDLPVNKDTIFAIASTTKAFTSLAVGLLVQDGKISWDNPVINHMEWFQLHDPWVTREFRVRDLLCNRCGLGPNIDLIWYNKTLNRDEVVQRLRYARPETGFRYEFAYRNAMFLTAGQIIPAVVGIEWDSFLTERIFKPLGMARTNTNVSDLKSLENVASPHSWIGGELVPVPYLDINNTAPAGSITSSIRDMAQWLRLHINEGIHDGKRIVEAPVIKETHTPHTPIPNTSVFKKLFPVTQRMDYCLSWLAVDHRGRLMIWHNGEIDGMHSVIGFLPEEKLGAVVLANADKQIFHLALFLYIVDSLIGAPREDWSTMFREDFEKAMARIAEAEKKLLASRKEGTRPSLPLDAYAGSYSNTIYGPVRIALENGRLAFHFSSEHIADLEHWHFDTFRGSWRDKHAKVCLGKIMLTFNMDQAGNVCTLKMGDIFVFDKVKPCKQPLNPTRDLRSAQNSGSE